MAAPAAIASQVPLGGQTSVPMSGASSVSGPMGSLDSAPTGVGVGVATPVSRAGGSSMDPMFGHGPGNTPGYHTDGSVEGLFRGAGVASAASSGPSPDETEGTVDLYTEAGAWFERINRNFHDENIMTEKQEDMIVFCEAEQRDPVQRRRGMDARRYTNVNVVVLNYVLACQAAQGDLEDDPRKVLERWGFDGVVATETGKDEQYYHNERGDERAFNMRMRGPELTYNLFGPNVQLGTRLYAIVRMFDVTGKQYNISASPTGTKYTVPAKKDGSKCYAYQVSFFGDYQHDIPPMESLSYMDQDGVLRTGAYTRLGTSGNNRPGANSVKEMTSPFPDNLGDVVAQPKIKMLVSQY